ncbi:MAG: sigma 54-interacting transcriptional regulator [Pseudomonadota bacterium]|nr:sigma 54-interacting transcriptional regulator [Pseudomonadota bacterium]
MREVVRLVGREVKPASALREILHLMSELIGLNRGRIVLLDEALSRGAERTASIQYSYGLTQQEAARGRYRQAEGITGRVLASGLAAIVQDVDDEPSFLFRAVRRDQLPPETVAFIALPIEINAVPVGVLACHRLRGRQRSLSDDMALLRVLATLIGQMLQLEQLVAHERAQLEARNQVLARAINAKSARYGLIGNAPALLRALAELERVAQAQATVLLLGESGTGKELFARALHLASPRREAPFIKVNCSAIPESLFESELFGHDRGAFTGAHAARVGWFEQAHGGTLFLDEIGELPLSMQAKLLRTLQEGTLVRLGGKHEIRVDVRLVAATHRDLAHEVAQGRFRQDLFYRLNVVPIALPSLRERREDVHALVLHFVSRANQAHERNVSFTPEALAVLEAHDWPGNVRELGNLVERVVLLADHSRLSAADLSRFLPAEPRAPQGVESPAQAALPAASNVRAYASAQSHSRETLQAALHQHQGNQSRAAQSLGLTLRQFGYRLRKAGLR